MLVPEVGLTEIVAMSILHKALDWLVVHAMSMCVYVLETFQKVVASLLKVFMTPLKFSVMTVY